MSDKSNPNGCSKNWMNKIFVCIQQENSYVVKIHKENFREQDARRVLKCYEQKFINTDQY
ncbi:unnamed protein product [Paramecium sonneborni]|uniref:Uncharacterized protein n=1 Tax=Paramecium sonneborni TaxID=65129 RepID=A0A8S1RPD5_9CILI|nr:unnamed protein product [Paramecium sonneborni]